MVARAVRDAEAHRRARQAGAGLQAAGAVRGSRMKTVIAALAAALCFAGTADRAGRGRPSSTAARRSASPSARRWAAALTAMRGWSAVTSASTSPAIRPSWCRTSPAPAATRPPPTSRCRRRRTAPRSARSSRAPSCNRCISDQPAAARSLEIHHARQRLERRLSLPRALGRAGEDLRGGLHQRGADRHPRRRRDLARTADPAGQRARREIPADRRLCRLERDPARDRAQRSPRHVRHELVEHLDAARRVAAERHAARSSCRRTCAAIPS